MVVSNRRQHRYNDPVRGLSKKPIPSIVAPSTAIENIRKFHKRPVPRNERSNNNGHNNNNIDIENRFGDRSSSSIKISGVIQRERSEVIDSQYSSVSHLLSSIGANIRQSDDGEEEESETHFWKMCPTKIRKNSLFLIVIICVTLIQLHGLHVVLEKSRNSNSIGVANAQFSDLPTILTLRKKQVSNNYDNSPVIISNNKISTKEENHLKDITMQYVPNNIESQDIHSKNDVFHPKDNRIEHTSLRSPNLVKGISSLPLENLSDMTQSYNPKTESLLFWDIQLSGETIAHCIFGVCYHLTRACEYGLQQPVFNEYSLETFVKDGIRFVNVDTTSKVGLQRGKKLKLVESRMADVIEIKELYLASNHLFSSQYKGRLFVLFRHPVHRAVDMYYYLAKASWDPRANKRANELTNERTNERIILDTSE